MKKDWHGVMGRRVVLCGQSGAGRRVYKITCVVKRDGKKFYLLDDIDARYHYLEQLVAPTVPPEVLKRMSQREQENYCLRLINPVVVPQETRWFPRSVLKFVRRPNER